MTEADPQTFFTVEQQLEAFQWLNAVAFSEAPGHQHAECVLAQLAVSSDVPLDRESSEFVAGLCHTIDMIEQLLAVPDIMKPDEVPGLMRVESFLRLLASDINRSLGERRATPWEFPQTECDWRKGSCSTISPAG